MPPRTAAQKLPLAHHTRILMIDSVPDTGEGVYDLRELYVARVAGNKRAGKLQAVVCRMCGHTELYVESPEEIPVGDDHCLYELPRPR